ncbi:T-protein [compost metagenome]
MSNKSSNREADLNEFRQQLDAVDTAILKLVAERMDIIHQVGLFKKQAGIPVMQPNRVATVLDSRAEVAQGLGINPDVARRIWDVLIKEACRLEEAVSG